MSRTKVPPKYDLDALLSDDEPTVKPESTMLCNNGDKPRITQADRMIEIAESSGVGLFHDEEKTAYLEISINGHFVSWPIESKNGKELLTYLFHTKTGRSIGNEALAQAIGVLSGRAKYESGEPVPLSVRVAGNPIDGLDYDMTNDDWDSYRITAAGWERSYNTSRIFRRFNHQAPQVVPIEGGDVKQIFNYVSVKRFQFLFLCWFVCLYVPGFPLAALLLNGGQGSAKTSSLEFVKMSVDPSLLKTVALPSDLRNFKGMLRQHRLIPFDNVSFLNEEMSDALCRAITGGGITDRALYTDEDATILVCQRAFAMNGINSVVTRADLQDRCIMIELEPIEESARREQAEIWASFEADRPYILGGVFDTLAAAMAIYKARSQALPTGLKVVLQTRLQAFSKAQSTLLLAR